MTQLLNNKQSEMNCDNSYGIFTLKLQNYCGKCDQDHAWDNFICNFSCFIENK